MVIPEPRHVSPGKGVFVFKPGMQIRAPAPARAEALQLREALLANGRIDLPVVGATGNGHFILTVSHPQKSARAPDLKHARHFGAEGYGLSVTPRAVTIQANTAAGIYYGLQTLLQLMDENNAVPCCTIEDWPDLALRGVHLDLKGCFPTYAYLESFVRRLGAFKINTILIEYEDKFPYRRHPRIALDYALTGVQIRGLASIAARNHIQIIPLLQCLGHVEYILKHKEYAGLRELPEEVSQYCPSNPASFTLFTELADEIMEAHPESRYFHIGGDETRLLGACPKCKRIAAEKGATGLYVDWLSRTIAHVKSRGKIPIMWDDILRHNTDSIAIDRLPRDVVLMYWKYGPAEKTISSLEGVCSKAWLGKQLRLERPVDVPPNIRDFIEDMPEAKIRLKRKYMKTSGYPLFFKSLPFIEYYRKNKFKMLGAPSISASSPHLIGADFTKSIGNIRLWSGSMHRANQLGVITTIWARMSSFAPPKCPLEMMWYGITAVSEFCWAVDRCLPAQFDRKFNRIYFGLDGSEVTDALYLLESTPHEPTHNCAKHAHRMLQEALSTAKKNRLTLEYLVLAADILRYKRGWALMFNRFVAQSYRQLERGEMPPPRARLIMNFMGEYRKEQARLAADLKKLLKKDMAAADIAEKINALFHYESRETARVLRLAGKISRFGVVPEKARSIYQ